MSRSAIKTMFSLKNKFGNYVDHIYHVTLEIKNATYTARSASHILSILFRSFGFIAPKTLNYLAFQSVDFERT
jgi:hypothetical protein